jgi:hypothetical protein
MARGLKKTASGKMAVLKDGSAEPKLMTNAMTLICNPNVLPSSL